MYKILIIKFNYKSHRNRIQNRDTKVEYKSRAMFFLYTRIYIYYYVCVIQFISCARS